CSPAVLGIQVDVLTRACPSAPAAVAPSTGVTRLRITLTGDGLQSQTVVTDFGTGTAQIPDVPVGTGRRIVVDALAGPAVRAHADSGPFDASGPADVHLTLFLRAIDAFTPTADASAACSKMVTPRAGHAMTLLPDGRVMITGGFSFDGSTPPQLVYHGDAEVFDPQTGQFAPLVPGPTLRRADHAALPLTVSSKPAVLLAGGEGPTDPNGTGAVTAIKPLEILVGSDWSQWTPEVSSPSRDHVAAAVDLRTGAAVLAGGQAGPDKPGVSVYGTLSWFDPVKGSLQDAAAPLRAGLLTDAVAVARTNDSTHATLGGVVLVGGRDGSGNVLSQVSGVVWGSAPGGSLDFIDDATFIGSQWMLPSPRTHHAALRMPDDTVLTAGGVTAMTVGAFDYSSPTAEITVIDPPGGRVYDLPSPLSQARADACAVSLADGRALFAGGAWRDDAGLHSARNVDLVAADHSVRSPGGPDALPDGGVLVQARHRAACIRLRDGSVLITGGMQYPASGGTPVVLDSAEIYQP
ncbi:MAG TPA: kelch repeat-containing protein, partial [Myxococcales bacterium]|nr:kelch repeat-containing protein [Myxococcales bacterium]